MYSFEKRRLFGKLVLLNILFTGIIFGVYHFFVVKYSILNNELFTSLYLWLGTYLIGSLILNFVYLNKLYFNPLFKVTKEMAAVLANRTYSKISCKTKDEFGLIGYFFNEMTKNIEKVAKYLKEGSRMASELALASEIQKSVLPKSLPEIQGLDVVAKSRPAEEVGGDSFDIDMGANGEYFFYVGDVTGHGAPAGLIMMIVNTLFDVFLPTVSDTKELAVKINETLKPRVNAAMFMTTSFFRWNTETKRLFYTGAGHENIVIYRSKEGISEVFPAGGIALAMAEDITNIVDEKEIILNENDVMILYTDGITEAVNEAGVLFGLENLKLVVNEAGHLGNSLDIFEYIATKVQNFVGETIQNDDMTLLVIRKTEQVMLNRGENLLTTKWNE